MLSTQQIQNCVSVETEAIQEAWRLQKAAKQMRMAGLPPPQAPESLRTAVSILKQVRFYLMYFNTVFINCFDFNLEQLLIHT